MKRFIVLLIFLVQYASYSQESPYNEKPPIFTNCEDVSLDAQQNCFNSQVHQFIYDNFKVPQNVTDANYKGEVSVIFEVNVEGQFKVVYTDALYDELKEETKRVFDLFPTIKPGTYNGKPTFKQYSIAVKIPLVSQDASVEHTSEPNEIDQLQEKAQREFDSINNNLTAFTNKAYSSQLNIPFIHSDYARFDSHMNRIGTNSHTASKPFIYEDVSRYYDIEKEKESLNKESRTWAEKKLWNEHLVELQGKDYWFTI
ncbi:MAG: gliding motility protein RemB, partial [Flavobacteriales bacterium]